MTENDSSPMLDSKPDRNYYAVRPALVLSASELFDIPSSILGGGAKSLHSKAAAIAAGKVSGNWGRHKRSVIEQFCGYTQSAGCDYLLPWQELVEHDMNYDQKEGISPRTGNKPLSTADRVQVDPALFGSALAQSNKTLSELSESCALPITFLEAIKSGEWREISETSAKAISSALETDIEEIFQPIRESAPSSTKSGDKDQPAQKNSTLVPAALATLLILLVVSIGLLTINRQSSVELLDSRTITNSIWHVSILLENNNLPIDDVTRDLFANGGYLKLVPDGSILFNWIDPKRLMPIPYTADWKLINQQVMINLGGIVYQLEPSGEDRSLSGYDTTRAFSMVMVPISLEEAFTEDP